MTGLINFENALSFETAIQYVAKGLEYVTKNNSVEPKNNIYYNCAEIIESEESLSLKVALPFRVDNYLDSNGKSYYSSVKSVSPPNNNVNIEQFSVYDIDNSNFLLYDAQNDIDSLEKYYVWLLTELWKVGNESVSVSIVSKPSYDSSLREQNLNHINVNYPHILCVVELNLANYTFNYSPKVIRSKTKLSIKSNLKNKFQFKRCIRKYSGNARYTYNFKNSNIEIERVAKLDISSGIDEIFANHDTLGEYIASLSGDDGSGGKFLNRSGQLQLATEKAEGVDNIGKLDYDDYKDMNRDEFESFVKNNTGSDSIEIGTVNLSGDFKVGFDVSPMDQGGLSADLSDLLGGSVNLDANGGSGGDRLANASGGDIINEARENTLSDLDQFFEARDVSRIPNDFGLILPDLKGLTKMDTAELNWKGIESGYLDQLSLDLGSIELRISPFPRKKKGLLVAGEKGSLESGGDNSRRKNPLYEKEDPYKDFLKARDDRLSKESKVSFGGIDGGLDNLVTTKITTKMLNGFVTGFGESIEGLDPSSFMVGGGSGSFGVPGSGGGMSGGGGGSFQPSSLGNESGVASGQQGGLKTGSSATGFGFEESVPRNYVAPNSAFEFPEMDMASFEVNVDVSVNADFSQIEVPELSLDLLEGFIDNTIFGDAQKLVEDMAETASGGNTSSNTPTQNSSRDVNNVNEKRVTEEELVERTSQENLDEEFADFDNRQREQFLETQQDYFESLDQYEEEIAQFEKDYADYVKDLEDINISKELKINKFNQENLNAEVGLFGSNKLTPYLELLGKQVDVYNLHQVENIKERFIDDVDSAGHVAGKIKSVFKKTREVNYKSNFDSLFGYAIRIQHQIKENISKFGSRHGVLQGRDYSDLESSSSFDSVKSLVTNASWKLNTVVESFQANIAGELYSEFTFDTVFESLDQISKFKKPHYNSKFTSDHGVLKKRQFTDVVYDYIILSWGDFKASVDLSRYSYFQSSHYKVVRENNSDVEYTLDFTRNTTIKEDSDYLSEFVIDSDLFLSRSRPEYETLFSSKGVFRNETYSTITSETTFNSSHQLLRANIVYDFVVDIVEKGIEFVRDLQFTSTFDSDHGILRGRDVSDIEYQSDLNVAKVEWQNKANSFVSQTSIDSIRDYEKVAYTTDWITLIDRYQVEDYRDYTRQTEFISAGIAIRRNLTYLLSDNLHLMVDGKYVVIEAVDVNYSNFEYQTSFVSEQYQPKNEKVDYETTFESSGLKQ